MKEQIVNNPVSSLFRQIISRFVSTKTAEPRFDTAEQSTTELHKKCIMKQAGKKDIIMPTINVQDIPSATDYGSTY